MMMMMMMMIIIIIIIIIVIIIMSASTFYSILIYPTRCNVTQFILSGNCSTCFGRYHHPSSGTQTTVSAASGIFITPLLLPAASGR